MCLDRVSSVTVCVVPP